MELPSVDIVIPFHGSSAELAEILGRLTTAPIAGATTTTVVDNRRDTSETGSDLILAAPELQTSYYARNAGAARGSAEWILFLDADVVPSPDLVERYFDPSADPRTAVLAGGVVDEAPADDSQGIVAFAHSNRRMSQENTLNREPWSYAQTANCAVRRSAFEEIGGFVDGIRSGGDADLCFRLAARGWRLEPRPAAQVVHLGRTTLRQLLTQRLRQGSGAAWLDRAHPGSFPAPGLRRRLQLTKWTLGSLVRWALAMARGDRSRAVLEVVEPLDHWAFEVGRHFNNEKNAL